MLFNLMGCAKEVDSKAKLLKWKKDEDEPLNSNKVMFLKQEDAMDYINIPGNPSKLTIGKTYYQVGIRVATTLPVNRFIAIWNNLRYEANKNNTPKCWISMKAAEVQESDTAYAVGYFSGTTERGDYETLQNQMQEICQYPVEVSYQLLNQTILTKKLWKEARKRALQTSNDAQSKAYKKNLFNLAPAALTVYVYKMEHVKPIKYFLMQEFGEALDDGTWPILQDGSRSKFIPLMKKVPKRKDVKQYLQESMENQITSKAVEIGINIDIWDIKKEKEYLRGQSIEQIIHNKLSDRRKNVPLIKHISRRWTKNVGTEDSYELMVQPNMYDESYQYIKTFRNQLVKEYGSAVTRHFWSKSHDNSHMIKSNTPEMDIMEDDDEILISQLNKEKDK